MSTRRRLSTPLSLLALTALMGLCWTGTASSQPAAEARGELHRFALVVGVNEGGASRVPLRYATRDAHAFADVMVQLGGIDPRDVMHVERADLSLLRVSLQAMAQRISDARARGEHTEFLLFYSGHSDEQGLRIGESLMAYPELRQLVTSVDADVRIAVVDSCASGALTRLKGGTRRPPFLFDLSSEVRGHAFLTSASGDEAAQESDRIKASFFTHYLVSGLRGAADFNADGRVTLNEAYRFAFDETLARTERTQAGAQHPAYDIQLAGTGDLVMTDLRAADASLGLPEPIAGRLFIRDAGGHLVAELSKPAGRAIELSLPPGDYTVALEAEDARREGTIHLLASSTHALSADDLHTVSPEATRERGKGDTGAPGAGHAKDGAAGEDGGAPSGGATKDAPGGGGAADTPGRPVRHIPFAFSFFSPLDSNDSSRGGGARIENDFQFNLLWGRTDRLAVMQFGIANHTDERMEGVQLAYALNSSFGKLDGVQVAGGLNIHDGDAASEAVQVAAGLNLHRAPGELVQVAAGLNGASGETRGVQVAAGVNVALQSLTGVQLAAGVNVAADFEGVQVGSANIAADAHGGLAQVGVLNVAGGKRHDGPQVGLLNVSSGELRGPQVGVLNYASRATAQVGLLSITPDVHVQAWTSNAGVLMASLRFDADYTYSLLSVGTSFADDGGDLLAGFGLGVKSPALGGRFFIELDSSAYVVAAPDIDAEYSPVLTQTRLMLRAEILPQLHVFAGPVLNTYYAHTQRYGGRDKPGYGKLLQRVENGNYTHQLWPGFVLGVGL